jgi:hypothetical protein
LREVSGNGTPHTYKIAQIDTHESSVYLSWEFNVFDIHTDTFGMGVKR